MSAAQSFMGLIGTSAAVRDLNSDISIAAAQPVGVLISGEPGVGKHFVARLLHHQSRVFISVCCSNQSEAWLERALFDSVKGALIVGNGATVYLSEVGQLSALLQRRLLEFIDARAMRAPRAVRLIAATSTPLVGDDSGPCFREDLYYRLNTVHLAIPALRERHEDVEPLMEYFAAGEATRRRVPLPRVTRSVRAAFSRYQWPGNVRELKEATEALVRGSGRGSGPQVLTPAVH